MKQGLLYSLFIIILFSACEEVYFPKIDEVDNAIVVDARLEAGRYDNLIVLTQTQGFYNEYKNYPELSGASVTLLDNEGGEFVLPEVETGKFKVNKQLKEDNQYKIRIDYGGNTFESEYENVPGVPKLDSIYGIPEVKTIAPGGSGSSDDFRKVSGVQLYANLTSTVATPNFRFTAEKVLQSYWAQDLGGDLIMHYYWKKTVAQGIFNIAAPPEYSASNKIEKHPLYFIGRSAYLEDEQEFAGWILVLYQHSISKSTYDYYEDLNAQLDADGRIFDPIYVQARNNFTCLTNSDEIILGNFEISQKVETRYYIRYLSPELGYKIKELDDRSPIPWRGETIDEYPDFWAH